MTPIVDGLQAEFEGQADVLSRDAARPEIVQEQQRYGVQGHPTFVVLDAEGNVAATFFGPQDAETLRTAVTAVLPAPAD